MHLLLADDDEPTRYVVKRALAGLDAAIRVHEARDGLEAMELLRSQRVDAILTDYRMPGASGVDVLRCAQDEQPHARRLLMSGTLAEAMLRDVGLAACIDFCFEKPMARAEWTKLLRLGLEMGPAGETT